jgi:hypothetical protein
MSNPVFKELRVRIPANPEEMTVKQLTEWEKSLGTLRMEIRRIQLELRKIMESKGWSPGEPEKLFVKGVPSSKGVGIPGG